MKVVKSAVIEVVGFWNLKEGDYIMWGNWKRKVIEIDRKNLTVLVDGPITEQLKVFGNYYVIKSCEEAEVYAD
ncbi:MAG: hypothetical protein KAJ39_07365 [Gammaproteobacteria bacterium]|nr:hypothetical protein [Gammaproteobacteria bacterium]